LENSIKKRSEYRDHLECQVIGVLERVLMEAELLPYRDDHSNSFVYTNGEPSPTVERPYSYMYEKEPPGPGVKSSAKTLEADAESATEFPTLSAARLYISDETPNVDVEASQSAEQRRRRGEVSPNLQNKSSRSSLSSILSSFVSEDEGIEDKEIPAREETQHMRES
jgi:hypothetical protein